MLKLFQAVHDAGSTPDYDNDDLRDSDQGVEWHCLVDKLPEPLNLLTAAVRLMGTVVRGVEMCPNNGQVMGSSVIIYLTNDYEDEVV